MLPYDRPVVIFNPNSSGARDTEENFIKPLDAAYKKYVLFETPSPNMADNVEAIGEFLRPGDRALIASGDGVGSVAINALLEYGLEDKVGIGFLAGGNSNDLASTFTKPQGRRITSLSLLAQGNKTVKLRPLQITKNDEHVQWGALYASFGWTAQAAAEFDKHHIRQRIKRCSRIGRQAVSIGVVTDMYRQTWANSHLAPFVRDGSDEVHTKTTDVLAINGPVMAGLMHSMQDYHVSGEFLGMDLDVSRPLRHHQLLAKCALNFAFGTHLRLPGTAKRSDTLHFVGGDAIVPMQIDGETQMLTGVDSVTVSKEHDRYVQVVTTR